MVFGKLFWWKFGGQAVAFGSGSPTEPLSALFSNAFRPVSNGLRDPKSWMWVASPFDVPVVVIFGPTDPMYTATNLEQTVVVRKELSSSPCHKKICPRQHECMREIKPAEVFAAAETLLSTCA